MAGPAEVRTGPRYPTPRVPRPPADHPPSIYDPPGPVSEALASYYVRHVVQRALDRAFMLAG